MREKYEPSYEAYEKLLIENNVNNNVVSQQTDIPYTTLFDWKNGRSKPKVDKMVILAKFFEVDLMYFYDYEAYVERERERNRDNEDHKDSTEGVTEDSDS